MMKCQYCKSTQTYEVRLNNGGVYHEIDHLPSCQVNANANRHLGGKIVVRGRK